MQLDAHVREIVEWHFHTETGCPFWLDFGLEGRPIFTFETAGTTGVPLVHNAVMP